MSVAADLEHFYSILGELQDRLGGPRCLSHCDGRMGWPPRGVYFFFEDGEHRAPPHEAQPRIVRVGTHGIAKARASGTKLWHRLKQHRGNGAVGLIGSGNHRGSVFRRHVGAALIASGRLPALASWGVGSSAPAAIRDLESEHERAVSAVIGCMPVIWVAADDLPSTLSIRAVIEQNSIGLLCRARAEGLDVPSADWLGRYSPAVEIRQSGLWNVDHVETSYNPAFLKTLESLALQTPKLSAEGSV